MNKSKEPPSIFNIYEWLLSMDDELVFSFVRVGGRRGRWGGEYGN
jgi:hypothetical protein